MHSDMPTSVYAAKAIARFPSQCRNSYILATPGPPKKKRQP